MQSTTSAATISSHLAVRPDWLARRCEPSLCPHGAEVEGRQSGQSRVRSRAAASILKIGIISDTHGLVRPEALRCLGGVHHIIHAGDIGHPEVISELSKIAPITAIRGNIDRGGWASGYPHTALVKLSGRSIYVLHNLKELDFDPAVAGIDVVVSGHSHRPKIETVNGVLYLNPGSAGPRRFSLPIALAMLELAGQAFRPSIHEVGVEPSHG